MRDLLVVLWWMAEVSLINMQKYSQGIETLSPWLLVFPLHHTSSIVIMIMKEKNQKLFKNIWHHLKELNCIDTFGEVIFQFKISNCSIIYFKLPKPQLISQCLCYFTNSLYQIHLFCNSALFLHQTCINAFLQFNKFIFKKPCIQYKLSLIEVNCQNKNC